MIRSTADRLGPTGAPAVLFTVATLLLFPRRTPLRTLNRTYLWLGAVLFVAYEVCFPLAIGLARNHLQAIEIGMVNYLWPSLTVLASAIAGRRRIGAAMLAGLALAFAGVVVASSPHEGLALSTLFQGAADNPLAYGLAFAGAVIWALYSTCTKHLAEGRDALWFFMALSAAAFWLLRAAGPSQAPMRFDTPLAIEVALASLAVTAAYALWNVGILRGSIQTLALAANGTPLLSALFASALLGTPLGLAFWAGAAMVAAGSLVASRAT